MVFVVLSKTTPSSRTIREILKCILVTSSQSFYRLGNPGGVSHEDTSTLLGLGEGTVLLYTNRVLEALDSLR